MLRIQTLSLAGTKVQMPIWEKQSTISGKTIVITAGMDGDEYAGIEGAYELIRVYSQKQFSGQLIIIPIVNIPGFEKTVSYNPLDNKFPKHIFPGKKEGSSTEQLVYFLSEKYISKADVWIDLHSGAINESLTPFIWAWETGNKKVDFITKRILSNLDGEIKVFEKNRWQKVQNLAKENTNYILLESGQLGQRKKEDINWHVKWVATIINGIQKEKITKRSFSVFTKVHYYNATDDGVWYPSIEPGSIQKGQPLGEILSFDRRKKLKSFSSKENGILLWYRTSLNAKKGDVLVAIGSDPSKGFL